MKVFETRARVRYGETDASGIVYYASYFYFLYFEVGRVAMFRALSLPYDARLPIAETTCRYRASARFNDHLAIHSFVQEIRSKGFVIGCRVHRITDTGDLELLVEGHTGMVTTGADGRPEPLPPAFREALEAAAAGT
ncbi:MAG: acyl-CoA thioesterase [Deltaproteobacteria bacterium]|nr:acyl-CoA thioesterase [Deltaproteobacteria bacterium]